jgi:NTE family protein
MQINGVFEGGGVKGIALVGAIAASEQAGLTFHQIAGTSAGAIVAALLAAGYNADELKQILGSTAFTQFIPTTWVHRLRPIGPLLRLLIKQGLHSPEPLEKWLDGWLRAKGVVTFADLPVAKLRIIASDISQGRLLVLPDDLGRYGLDANRFSVARAVSMSARIPYFFDPARLQNSMVVDGALLSNFPIWIFDSEQVTVRDYIPTIGFQLYDRASARQHVIRGPLSMFKAMFSTMMTAHDRLAIEEEQRFRSIVIPTLGVGTTQFDVSKTQRMKLYESGYVAGSAFFRDWNVAGYHKQFVKQVATARQEGMKFKG